MKKVMKQVELRVKAYMTSSVGLPTSSSSISLRPSEAKKRRGNMMDASFNMGVREELNAIITRMFYYSDLSFNFVRNSYYVMAFTYAANNPFSGYIPPGYNSLRITLLQNEKSNIERESWNPSRARGVQRVCLFVVMDGRMHKGGRSLISWPSRKVEYVLRESRWRLVCT